MYKRQELAPAAAALSATNGTYILTDDTDVTAGTVAAKAGQTDDDGTDDEEPPQFGAADPV